MILTAVSLLPLGLWAYLLFGRGWFWLCRERDERRRGGERGSAKECAGLLARRRGDHPGPR